MTLEEREAIKALSKHAWKKKRNGALSSVERLHWSTIHTNAQEILKGNEALMPRLAINLKQMEKRQASKQ